MEFLSNHFIWIRFRVDGVLAAFIVGRSPVKVQLHVNMDSPRIDGLLSSEMFAGKVSTTVIKKQIADIT